MQEVGGHVQETIQGNKKWEDMYKKLSKATKQEGKATAIEDDKSEDEFEIDEKDLYVEV